MSSTGYQDKRREPRVNSELPVEVSIGTQLTLQGQLKDLSLESAFIRIRHSVFLQANDEIRISIHCSANEDDVIKGLARISRIVVGEGLAVYFTKIDNESFARLKALLQKTGAR